MKTLYLFDDDDEGGLTTKVATTFIRDLDEVLEDNPRAIRVRLMTEGGSQDAAFAIYDCLRGADARVQIIGHGMVMSAGILLLQAGDERLLMPNTSLLLHKGEVSLSGPLEEVANAASYYQHRDERVYRLLAQSSGQSYDTVVEQHVKGLTIPAGQAVKWGYADEVLTASETAYGTPQANK